MSTVESICRKPAPKVKTELNCECWVRLLLVWCAHEALKSKIWGSAAENLCTHSMTMWSHLQQSCLHEDDIKKMLVLQIKQSSIKLCLHFYKACKLLLWLAKNKSNTKGQSQQQRQRYADLLQGQKKKSPLHPKWSNPAVPVPNKVTRSSQGCCCCFFVTLEISLQSHESHHKTVFTGWAGGDRPFTEVGSQLPLHFTQKIKVTARYCLSTAATDDYWLLYSIFLHNLLNDLFH